MQGTEACVSPEIESPPSLESETLFNLDFVCLVGEALRVRARRLTLKQYLGFQHVLVEIREGQQALVDRALSQLGAKRNVALTLPFFVPAIFAISQTDLILTVPRRLAKITAVMAGVRVVEAPREIKSFRISWRAIRDSPMNLPTNGFVNNCGRGRAEGVLCDEWT